MLTLVNTLGKKTESFQPVNPDVVNVFTCGPSVYQRSHIGNFRTFLFEDILVRYLEYSGCQVRRGLILTDIEDKAIDEARSRKISVKDLTNENIKCFTVEMRLLKMKVPDYMPRASDAVNDSAEMIQRLLDLKIAYRHKGNIYFDPLKSSGFGKLYGLDMTKWPTKRKRFHRDTYPGMRWNFGDFVLWHGADKETEALSWETRIGKGRPSWNIQDASVIYRYFDESLSIYCGGIDNLIRHHDYTCAILESVRPYPAARFWLHGHHLIVNGEKMSKSKGNIYYTDTLLDQGYDRAEIRFFLIYGHYRKKLNYSSKTMDGAAQKLRKFKERIKQIEGMASQTEVDRHEAEKVESIFSSRMDPDLDVKGAFDALDELLEKADRRDLSSSKAAGLIEGLKRIDEVLRVLF
jgi:cysteinyl-tRNA synthetase